MLIRRIMSPKLHVRKSDSISSKDAWQWLGIFMHVGEFCTVISRLWYMLSEDGDRDIGKEMTFILSRGLVVFGLGVSVDNKKFN